MQWNEKILGHERSLSELSRMIESKKLPNALLFIGPSQVGKFRIARNFSQLLNAGNDQILRAIERNLSPDVITIGDLWQEERLEDWDLIAKTSNFDQSHRVSADGETGKRSDTIGITDMRKFFEPLFQSRIANYKVGIIRDAERMSTEAANLALKTLEEPPERCIFILTAVHEKRLPPTIVSRCQIVRFNLVSGAILSQYLEKRGVEEDLKRTMLMLAQGRSEHVQRFLEDTEFLEKEKRAYQEISRYFFVHNLEGKVSLAEEIARPENALLLEEFLDNLTRFCRSVLLEKIQGKKLPIVEQISYAHLLHIFSTLHEVKFGLNSNGNRRLLLERLLFSIP